MTYLVGLIVAVLLGGAIAFLSFQNIGESFKDSTGDGETQNIITRAAEIESAFIAYKAMNSNQAPAFDFSATHTTEEILQVLVDENLLKARVSDSASNVNLEIVQDSVDPDKGIVAISIDNEEQCKEINFLRADIPITEDPVPACNDSASDGYPCCTKS